MASAGTAQVAVIDAREGDPGSYRHPALRYTAADGERNDVTVTTLGNHTLRIADRGAPVIAGDGCRSVDASTADCHYPDRPSDPRVGSFLVLAEIEAGDLADRVESGGPDGPRLYGDGGTGDDVLLGSHDKADVLDGGGGGRDELRGRGNGDVLTDGDRSGSADADLLDGGGGGDDTLTYAQRTRPMTIDLTSGSAGEPGERDDVRGFQAAVGGSGADGIDGDRAHNTLVGGGGDDHLDGNGGRDRLLGEAGGDRLHGHDGDDTLDGGPGSDQLRGDGGDDLLLGATGTDRLRCGAGLDAVRNPSRSALLPRACETVGFVYETTGPGAGTPTEFEGRFLEARAHPISVSPRSLVLGLRCPAGFQDPPGCPGAAGTFRIDALPAGRGALGVGRLGATQRADLRRDAMRPNETRLTRLPVRLTSRGRRMLARGGPVPARVSIDGRGLPNAGWTIRLGG